MAKFTALDERFAHQIPEPFPNVVHYHQDWRESLFFIMHQRDKPGDVLILTLAHFAARQEMDSLQLGRVGDSSIMARHVRKVDGDQDDFRVGPITIDIAEPLKRIHLTASPSAVTPVSFDITFTARTAPYQLRRGTMKAKHEIIWDQSHMFQSGIYNGSYTHNGETHRIDNWWGQRDHSWGVRSHARCPLWMWMPIQLEEGMLSVWHWEYPNGARVYTDGCFAPADGSEPIPVIDFQHDLQWQNASGQVVSYEKFGDDVKGLAGTIAFTLQGGRKILVEATGRWAQRYSAITNRTDNVLGGGLSEMQVRTSDGATGTAIFEITGQYHHKYFPIARGSGFPPDGA
ncbi:hypothetical protein LBMAG16_11530 [Actinomycetes bacterium]|nr:hypothetical protein LBMAG16_11530 [Actinomycetes bacterium]